MSSIRNNINNLHVGVTVLRSLSATPFFFSLLPFLFICLFIFLFRRIICAIFLCNKNIGHHARLRGKDHRTSSTIRLPVTGNSHFEKERTVFWHFQ